MNYEIIKKKYKQIPWCGSTFSVYEIKYRLSDDTFLHLFATDLCLYCLSKTSLIDLDSDGLAKQFKYSIESFESFAETKKSKYSQLYEEMQAFIRSCYKD